MRKRRYSVEVDVPGEVHEVFRTDSLKEAWMECRSLRVMRKDARIYDRKLRKHIGIRVF